MKTMKRATRLLLVLLLAAAPLPAAFAQSRPADATDTAPLPDWEHLSPQQREVLIGALRQKWNDIPDQRARTLHHAERWQAMTPEQRQRAADGMRRYEHMNPEQRRQAKVLFGEMHKLPPAQRDALRARWKTMSPQQRDEWVRAHAVDADQDD